MAVRGGIKVENLHPSLVARLLSDLGLGTAANEALQRRIGTRPGVRALNILNVGANVVGGDTINVGVDAYQVDIINTDSLVNTDAGAPGALGATGTHALVTLGAAPATAINAGDVIRIESELLLVLRKLSTITYVCARAYGGSVIAAHAANLDVFVSSAVPATKISVPLVITLTPAAFAAAFVAVFNFAAPAGESLPIRTPTLQARYTAMPTLGLGLGAEILVVAKAAGVDVTATIEEFANSTDNVWSTATMAGGTDPGVAASEASVRVPTATEELLGEMHFAFPFAVRSVFAAVRITASGIVKLFAGTVLIGYGESTDAQLPTTIVTLRNVGAASTAYAAPFASTDTVHVIAFE